MKRWAPLLFLLALILLAVGAVYFPVPHSEQGYFSPLYSPDGAAVYFIARQSSGLVAGPLLGHECLSPPAHVFLRRDRFFLRRLQLESGTVDTIAALPPSPLEGRHIRTYRRRLFSVVTTALRWADPGTLELRLQLDVPVQPASRHFYLTARHTTASEESEKTAEATWSHEGESPVYWEQGSPLHGDREVVAVRSLDFSPCALVEYTAASGDVRVLQQTPACRRAFPQGIPVPVVESFSNRDHIERALTFEATEEELRQEAHARGLKEGDAEMEIISGMRERGLYPQRPQLLARPLTGDEIADLRAAGDLEPLFVISETEFQVDLFPDIEAALRTPGQPAEKHMGRYVIHRDFTTSRRLNQFLAAGGARFYVARAGHTYQLTLTEP
jgi:hypothetical protein